MNTILYTLGLDDLFLQKKDLTNYKINYKKPLGEGVFGSVYPLVFRPIEERSVFSRLFPCTYDKIFTCKKEDSDTGLCVKIFHSFYSHIDLNQQINPYPIKSFFEPRIERELNQTLIEQDLTNIHFYEKGWYYQVKTEVHGVTLSEKEEVLLEKEEGYPIRKALFNFLKKLIECPVVEFGDLHRGNIFYTHTGEIEIIDGSIADQEDKVDARIQLKNFFLYTNLRYFFTNLFIDQMTQSVLNESEYTEELDQEYLTLVHLKTRNIDEQVNYVFENLKEPLDIESLKVKVRSVILANQ